MILGDALRGSLREEQPPTHRNLGQEDAASTFVT